MRLRAVGESIGRLMVCGRTLASLREGFPQNPNGIDQGLRAAPGANALAGCPIPIEPFPPAGGDTFDWASKSTMKGSLRARASEHFCSAPIQHMAEVCGLAHRNAFGRPQKARGGRFADSRVRTPLGGTNKAHSGDLRTRASEHLCSAPIQHMSEICCLACQSAFGRPEKCHEGKVYSSARRSALNHDMEVPECENPCVSARGKASIIWGHPPLPCGAVADALPGRAKRWRQ